MHQGQNTTTSDQRSHRSTERCQILQQTGHHLGIQQRQNQRRRQIESSFPYKQRIIRTDRNVLWNEQLTGHFLSHDDNHI
jgi:hypothetical protein